MQGKTGVARLALATDVPVVPIAQWGPQFAYDRYHHKVSLFPRKVIRTTAGPPVDLSAYRGRPLTGELLREVTDHIMGAVREQLAGIRQETPPEKFWTRPASGEPGRHDPRPAGAGGGVVGHGVRQECWSTRAAP